MLEQALKNVLGFGVKEFIEKAIGGGYLHDSSPHLGWENITDIDVQLIHNAYRADFTRKDGVRDYSTRNIHEILLDPQAWKAVGKTEGWEGTKTVKHVKDYGEGANPRFRPEYKTEFGESPQQVHHRFIDELYKLEE